MLGALAVLVALIVGVGLASGDLAVGLVAIPVFGFPIAFVAGVVGRSFKVLHIDRYHIHLALKPPVAAAFARIAAAEQVQRGTTS